MNADDGGEATVEPRDAVSHPEPASGNLCPLFVRRVNLAGMAGTRCTAHALTRAKPLAIRKAWHPIANVTLDE